MSEVDERQAERLAQYRSQTIPVNMFSPAQRVPSDLYKENFDQTFKGAPGSKEWFDQKFGRK